MNLTFSFLYLAQVRVRRVRTYTSFKQMITDIGIHNLLPDFKGELDDAVKINISLTDLGDFNAVNTVMAAHFAEPFPARACVQVAALPKGARIEVEAILAL